MRILIAAIHGILTRQTAPSWPDRLDAWLSRRDPRCRVLKKEYAAGPFPRWNCLVKDPRLARGLANEIALFGNPLPPTWLVAHSNGAVIALLATQRLIERGGWVGGLILTGGACDADLANNGVLGWVRQGRLGAAIAYSSREDRVVAGDPRTARHRLGRWRARLWRALVWPYGSLGRTGWVCQGRRWPAECPELKAWHSRVLTRWHPGGHSGCFEPNVLEHTFERMHEDILAFTSQTGALR